MYVLTLDNKYLAVDPSCGFPAEDDYLCGRTTRWSTKKDAEQYRDNLKATGYKGSFDVLEDI